MNRSSTTLMAALTLLLGGASTARAQTTMGNPQGDIGVKVSETGVLHVGVTAEAGYDTNVFYNDSAKVQSAVLRVVPSLQITNAGRNGEVRAETIYDVGVSLLYREYLNNDPNVRAQRAFNPSAHASLALGGSRAFKLTLGDQFTRTEDPPYTTASTSTMASATTATPGPIVRDANVGVVSAGISPGGGRLTFTLRYTNTLDYYETLSYKHSTNMDNDVLLDASWKWLPKTALYVQGGVGFIHYLNPDADGPAAAATRHDSMPIRGLAGLRGLLTPKTTVSVGAGYATALYQGGPCDVRVTSCNPHGASNLLLTAEVGYQPTLLSRLGLGLLHGFRNSPVIGDFYDVDAVNISASQLVAKLVFSAFGRYEYRRYQGFRSGMTLAPVPRRDHVVAAGGQVDYYIQRWFYAGVQYSVTLDRANESELGPVAGTGLSYTKQQVFARIGVTY
jgi:hypothetical protein